MKRDNMPMIVIAAAIVVGALIWSGAPLSALLLPLILLACPLMMIFMMRGMDHGGQGDQDGRHAGCHGDHGGGHAGHDEHSGHRDSDRQGETVEHGSHRSSGWRAS